MLYFENSEYSSIFSLCFDSENVFEHKKILRNQKNKIKTHYRNKLNLTIKLMR